MSIELLAIQSLRALAIDATNAAKSGHPGMPIGSAPLVATLFAKHLMSDPTHPDWINRDRFVLSAGHASMLLYGILHLAGYALPMEQLKRFRQLGSLTPGHPEVHLTPGVDATTGPLGQGLAQAVGFALAERTLRGMYAQAGLIDHYTYVLSGDGCLQEGISQEAISFAGHQQLNKLILFYDANDVTLDGPLAMSFSEDVKKRFQASGWQVITIADGNDTIAIDKAIRKAKRSQVKPTMIMIKTIIGQGSKNQGTYKVHGNPLGTEDGLQAKASYGWTYPEFVVPQEVYQWYETTFAKRGKRKFKQWHKQLKIIETSQPEIYQRFIQGDTLAFTQQLPQPLLTFAPEYKDATRNTSLQVLNALAAHIPMLVGGSADVAKSVMTTLQGSQDMTPQQPTGRNINFGIREFAMASIQNGMMLHRGLRVYTGTFLAFADYMKPAIRLAALSHIPSIFVFSHDSVALGEDGPTHQPIDQLAMLRAIPNLKVFRPADARETLAAWLTALGETQHPTAIILSRQGLPLLAGSSVEKTLLGAYEVSASAQPTPWTLVATGSEVALAIAVQALLQQQGYFIKVVSMPSMSDFLALDEATQQTILGQHSKFVVTLEALSTFGWRVIGQHNLGIDTFGQSAPGPAVMAFYGMTPEAVSQKIIALIQKQN
jgi:transketolase